MAAPRPERPPTILVADDEPEIRAVLEAVLTDEGYAVVAVGDGEDALELTEARDPDLLVLDLVMPRLGALEVCRAYRERGGSAPVLLITATDEEAVAGMVAGCDADGYLTKPFDLDALVDLVARHLRDGRPPPA